jgi:DNA repair exonuclease SbcCD ATPase subunit
MTALQKTIVTATIAALAGAGIYEARQASQLSGQVQTLREQHAQQIQQLQSERDDATNKLAALRDDNERLNRNTSELLKLRGEVGALRVANGDVAKFNAEKLKLRQKVSQLEGMWTNWTNVTHFNNPFYSRESWEEQGTDEPLSALNTILSAIKRGDDQKLSQLVSREDASQSLDSLLLPKRVWDKVTGVQIVDIQIISDGSSQRKAIIGTILQQQNQPSESPGSAYDNPALEAYQNSKQSMHRWFFVETNGQWLITGGG